MSYPNSLKILIESFKKFPGIGEKTAERLAFSVLDLDVKTIDQFSTGLQDAKNKIKRCKICNHITEEDICGICLDNSRNREILCIVEEPKSVIIFEKIGSYKGLYHVLDGLISPIDGKNPEDINIESLVKRINEENFKEIIIALRPSVEGETTALYITKILSGTNIPISKIAYGIPMGADMEYIDSMTLEMAFQGRTKIS
jgi:recombination protein RecR